MIKIVIVSLSLLLIWSNRISAISCDITSNNCTINSFFNIYSCSCECFPSYSGTYCENLLCDTLDPDICKAFSKSQCSVGIIASYCPIFCLKCVQPTDPIITTTIPITTTTTAPTTTISTTTTNIISAATKNVNQCKTDLKCQNGGIFDPKKCECRCFPSYIGTQCEKKSCVPDDKICSTVLTSNQCNISIVKSLCPYLCGDCSNKKV